MRCPRRPGGGCSQRPDGLGQAVDAEYLLTLADPVTYAPQIKAALAVDPARPAEWVLHLEAQTCVAIAALVAGDYRARGDSCLRHRGDRRGAAAVLDAPLRSAVDGGRCAAVRRSTAGVGRVSSSAGASQPTVLRAARSRRRRRPHPPDRRRRRSTHGARRRRRSCAAQQALLGSPDRGYPRSTPLVVPRPSNHQQTG